ncbi:type II toxin-antitoxin system VapC family toxin [Kribbella sandramycini]|uniref:Ribonuclease VapC n=1 Tax=Kribbella sandramycini TaxID=60450 RepID=A0A7Y4L063_9ACTN|nr:type II toxin-antitoxin system VapC family toxin [Kribbella sandramycini]MBB6565627.1 putative nucleic acid-binding protein [Kribbella sandramycini]NOL41890.1 type II toxin-antitoxin system VapC family toxin [Kribbella sandramycini]
MICYFDTSAFVPLLIPEPSSPVCRQLWDDADDVLTTQLTFIETAGALAQAARRGRISKARETEALEELDAYWRELNTIDITNALVRRAAGLTSLEVLRGYDAVHCASAESVRERDLIFASGDKQLLKASANIGLHVADVNEPVSD